MNKGNKTKLASVLSTILLCAASISLCQNTGLFPNAYALDTFSASTLSKLDNLAKPVSLSPQGGALYYDFQTENGSKAHVIVADMKSGKWSVRPAISESTEPTADFAKKHKAIAAVNGGFFNLSDGVSASYVYIEGKQVTEPRTNKALVENPKLRPFLEHIFNRSELRIYEDKNGKQSMDITVHTAPIPSNTHLLYSLQAGPELVPNIRTTQEAFVRTDLEGKKVDAINAESTAARTAIGITPDGFIIMVAVSGKGQDPESSGISLKELSELMSGLGCSKALNLDGGASTTMFVKLPQDDGQGHTAAGKVPETRVKSALLLIQNEKLTEKSKR